MRILYTNVLTNYTTLTSDNPNASYPVANILSEFLLEYYKSTSTTDTIDITLDAAYDIDTVAFSYHNLTQVVVKLYDLSDTLQHTETITSPRDGEMVYFSAVATKRIEVELTGSSNCYLGAIYMGEYLQMPYQTTTPTFSRSINSFVLQTSGGQSTGQKRSVLKGHSANFTLMTQTQFDSITDMLISVQNVDKFYLDIWEGSTYLPPYYARVNTDGFSVVQDSGHGVLYDGTIEFIECK